MIFVAVLVIEKSTLWKKVEKNDMSKEQEVGLKKRVDNVGESGRCPNTD